MPNSMKDELLQEQLAYYRARAREYDETSLAGPELPEVEHEWQQIEKNLRRHGRFDSVLELACGTGLWTQHLADIGSSVLALDGAPEMLEVNRAKVGSQRVRYQQADLFSWQASETFDLVFAAFWLSHVPGDRLGPHLAQVARAVNPGGRVFFADEPESGAKLSGPTEKDTEQTRSLLDGSTFRIIKVYYNPEKLADQLAGLGFRDLEWWAGEYFFTLTGVRSDAGG